MNPIAEGYFAVVQEDLEAARTLLPVVPRASAYHLQQAAEKLVKAVLVVDGATPPFVHDIGRLVAALPAGHSWKADLMELDRLSRFATTYRYPSPIGDVEPPPDKVFLQRHLRLVDDLARDVEAWCRERQ